LYAFFELKLTFFFHFLSVLNQKWRSLGLSLAKSFAQIIYPETNKEALLREEASSLLLLDAKNKNIRKEKQNENS